MIQLVNLRLNRTRWTVHLDGIRGLILPDEWDYITNGGTELDKRVRAAYSIRAEVRVLNDIETITYTSVVIDDRQGSQELLNEYEIYHWNRATAAAKYIRGLGVSTLRYSDATQLETDPIVTIEPDVVVLIVSRGPLVPNSDFPDAVEILTGWKPVHLANRIKAGTRTFIGVESDIKRFPAGTQVRLHYYHGK